MGPIHPCQVVMGHPRTGADPGRISEAGPLAFLGPFGVSLCPGPADRLLLGRRVAACRIPARSRATIVLRTTALKADSGRATRSPDPPAAGRTVRLAPALTATMDQAEDGHD